MTVQSSLEILKNKQTVQAGYTVTTNLGFPKGRLTERFLALKYFYTQKPGDGGSVPYDTDIKYDLMEGVLNPFYNGQIIGVPAERKVSANPLLEAYHIGTNGIQSLVLLDTATLKQQNSYQGVMNYEETVRTWDMQGARNHLVADYPTSVGNGKEVNEFVFLQNMYAYPGDFFEYGPAVRTTETLLIDSYDNMPYQSEYLYHSYSVIAVKESTGEAIYYSNKKQWIYVKNKKKLIMNFDSFKPVYDRDNITIIDGKFVFDRVNNNSKVLEINTVTEIIDNGNGTCTCFTAQKTLTLPRSFYSNSRVSDNNLLLFEWGDELYVLQAIQYNGYVVEKPLAIYRIKKDLSAIIYEYVPEGSYVAGLCMQPFYDPAFPNQVLISKNKVEKNTLKLTPNVANNFLKASGKTGMYRRPPNASKAFGYSYLGNGIYALGFVDVEPPIVSFKLDNPIIKTPDETMKLTFDINIFNEEYYTSD